MHARSSLLQLAAFPRGGLTPAEVPLIDAEILFRQPQPAKIAVSIAVAFLVYCPLFTNGAFYVFHSGEANTDDDRVTVIGTREACWPSGDAGLGWVAYSHGGSRRFKPDPPNQRNDRSPVQHFHTPKKNCADI